MLTKALNINRDVLFWLCRKKEIPDGTKWFREGKEMKGILEPPPMPGHPLLSSFVHPPAKNYNKLLLDPILSTQSRE